MPVNKYIIISCGYNCKQYIDDWFKSIKEQDFLINNSDKVHFLVIDDASNDGTGEYLDLKLKDEKNVTIIHQKYNMNSLYNKSIAIKEHLELNDEDVIIGLDLDDYFYSKQALSIIDKIYQDENTWLTYGSLFPYTTLCQPINWSIPIRTHPWVTTHLRTYKWFLLKNILQKDLKDKQGYWYKFPEDRIQMYPLIEMAGPNHVYQCRDILYGYRIDNPNSDMIINNEKVQETLKEIINKEAYPRKSKEELVSHKCDWFNIPKKIYFYWGNKKMSFMRYMTLKSFRVLNPDWDIILITKKNKTPIIDKTWHEMQDNTYYSGANYFDKINELNIKIEYLEEDYKKIADLNLIDNYISDILNWYILAYKGGYKADMDVLFINPIINIVDNIDVSIYTYYDICACGFLFGTPNDFFKDIYHNCLSIIKNKKNDTYQSIGPDLFTIHCDKIDDYKKIKFTRLKNDTIYPFVDSFSWLDQLNKPYEENKAYNINKSIGMHWYAGFPLSKKFNELLTEENYKQHKNTLTHYINKILTNK